MLKKILIATAVIILLASGIYYFFFYQSEPVPLTDEPSGIPNVVFNPISRSGAPASNQEVSSASTTEPQESLAPLKIPDLRQLSTTPIGGFMASTTASSTVARYIDRGVGHVYEALSTENEIKRISNTTIQKIYESYWNKNLDAMILRYIKEGTGAIVNFYAEIRPLKTSTTTSEESLNEIKGKFLSADIREIAVSPKGDRVFTLNKEGEGLVGYISGFDESKKTKILTTPLLQLNADWPEENTIVLTTKASAGASGYLYFFDIKKSSLKKVLGKIPGFTAKTSSNTKKVIFSSGSNKVSTSLYDTADNSTQEVTFRTIADKCVWSRINMNDIYCAVPTEIPAGVYPDDWYKGNISFVDQIWYLDAATGQVRILANLLGLSNSLIDAVDLTLDPKENFLYFVNKRDLTLWSLKLD
ncbi:MAG: hypothetical protein Q8Q03_03065 [bacterium]|nr:hypothetical protein [bacterium]